MATSQGMAWLVLPNDVLTERQPDALSWFSLTKVNNLRNKGSIVTSSAHDVRGKVILLEFEYASWGGNGGQGLAIHMFDAGAPAAGSGGLGGVGLGYVNMAGAYIGIGLDESGSFSSIDAKKMSETSKDSGVGNVITVRGSQERGYALDGTFTLPAQTPLFYDAARYASRQQIIDDGATRRIVAKFTPKKYLPGYTIDLSVNGQPLLQGFDYPHAVPAALKVGVAATNGDRASNHDIGYLRFFLLDPVGLDCPSNGNLLRDAPAYIDAAGKIYAYPQLNDGDHVHRGWDGSGKWGDTIPADAATYGVDLSGAGCIDSDGPCAAPAANGPALMNSVVIYFRQDKGTEQEPSDTTTFTQHGAIDFVVNMQEERTSAFLPVATITGNNLAKRTVTFPRQRCTGLHVGVNKAASGGPSVVGLEAYDR
jgi:hypothetical protein